MAVAGCGDGGLCPRALEARLGMRREESWRRGITVLRLTLLRQEGNVEETGAAPFPVRPNVVRLLLSLFWPLYDISHFWLPLLHPQHLNSTLSVPLIFPASLSKNRSGSNYTHSTPPPAAWPPPQTQRQPVPAPQRAVPSRPPGRRHEQRLRRP